MCMGGPGCSGHKTSKSGNTYTPKSKGGSGKTSKSTYRPTSRASTMSSFGKPTVRMSFSGKR